MKQAIIDTDLLSEQIVGLIRNAFSTQAKNVGEYFSKHPDIFYEQPVAAGKNKANYILGHLLAANDGMIPLLGFGEKLFPELDKYFTPNTTWDYTDYPPTDELKEKWLGLTQYLEQQFDGLQPADWISRHTKVSEADFLLDPKRNKLNVLIGRITHMSYHLGQLLLLKDVS